MERSEPSASGPADASPRIPIQRESIEKPDSPEGQRLLRLLADLELLNDARAEGFQGPRFAELARALIEYGYQVLGAWIRSGVIFAKVAEKGASRFLAGHERRVPNTSHASELTNDVVADGLVAFRDEVLRPGRWDHTKGAALTTYFVGQCVLRFPSLYIEWLRAMQRSERSRSLEGAALVDLPTNRPYDDPAYVEEIRNRLAEGRKTTTEILRAILLLREQGYSHPEISEVLGISVGAIESRLHRHHLECARRRSMDGTA